MHLIWPFLKQLRHAFIKIKRTKDRIPATPSPIYFNYLIFMIFLFSLEPRQCLADPYHQISKAYKMHKIYSYRGYDHKLIHFRVPVSGSATKGAYSIIEQDLPEGFKGPGKHRHKAIEQTIKVVRGTVIAQIGAQEMQLNAGEYVHVPPNTYHDFYPSNGGACIQSIQSPAGLEDMFLEWANIDKNLAKDEYSLKVKCISDKYDNGQ